MADDSIAQDQIVAFVDRILRMKGEAQAIKDDIRDIYAEAKSNGFDKTVLGKIVSYVEKREADSNAVLEGEAIFDLYLSAYDSAKGKVGTRVATHTHAPEPWATLEANSRARMTGSMADNKTLSAQMLKDGLISEEAHAENVQLADGLARKFGNGSTDTPIQQSVPLTADATESNVPRKDSVADIQESQGEGVASRVQPAQPVQPHAAVANSVVEPEAGESSTNGEGGSNALPDHSPGTATSGDVHGTAAGESPAILSTGLTADANVGGENVDARPANTAGEPVMETAPAAHSPEQPQQQRQVRVPGETWTERTPPVGVHWHDFARCFPERRDGNYAGLLDDIRENGVRYPIVKIGDDILDGRARYLAARDLGIEYPVTEYGGSDPLADVIRWNLENRSLSTNERKAIASKLMKLPAVAHRASEIAALFGLELEGAV